jgi:pimeloyl-ACP methyl ester carboxylesterase
LVAPQLAASGRVLRYDTRGAGLSEKIRGSLTIDTMVADLMALLGALEIGDRVVLMGMAVGGAIALAAAARHPDRVAAVVASSAATSVAADRRAAVLARVERMEREGLRAVLDGLDNGYAAELRGDAARFAAFRARWLGADPASIASDLSHALANRSRQRACAHRLPGPLDRRHARRHAPAQRGHGDRRQHKQCALPAAAHRPLCRDPDAGKAPPNRECASLAAPAWRPRRQSSASGALAHVKAQRALQKGAQPPRQ